MLVFTLISNIIVIMRMRRSNRSVDKVGVSLSNKHFLRFQKYLFCIDKNKLRLQLDNCKQSCVVKHSPK